MIMSSLETRVSPAAHEDVQGDRTMKTLRNLFHRQSGSYGRFDRYYGRILRSGTGGK